MEAIKGTNLSPGVTTSVGLIAKSNQIVRKAKEKWVLLSAEQISAEYLRML